MSQARIPCHENVRLEITEKLLCFAAQWARRARWLREIDARPPDLAVLQFRVNRYNQVRGAVCHGFGAVMQFTPGAAGTLETTMKKLVLVGALAGVLTAGLAFAQGGSGSKGRTAPSDQPSTAPSPTVPTGDMALGSIRLPKAVMADGKKLDAGTYQVRVTGQAASPDAKGQTPGLERWLEFVQGGQVKGREVVTIVPQSDLKLVEKDAPPQANSSKFETLIGGDYARLWINRGGNHYLVHFPTA